MKIVICDDSIEDLSSIEKYLIRYLSAHSSTDFQVEKYSDPARLSHEISSLVFADIYILDMIMEEHTGIDIGRQLRSAGCANPIIYITSSDEFALDAYQVHAVRYLLKPLQESNLFEALDYALSCTKVKSEPVYLVKTKDGLMSIPFSRIEYVENAARMLDIHLTDGDKVRSIFIRKSFDDETKQLTCDRSFLQVHKSFVVNLNYVKQLTPNDALMDSGARIPISKTRAAGVKKLYLTFVSEQYR